MVNLIGICGEAGAGKDTAASTLVEMGWIQTSFAKELYKEVAEAFNVTVASLEHRETKEQPLAHLSLDHCSDAHFVDFIIQLKNIDPKAALSPRFLLQHWGTEFRRGLIADTYWTDKVDDFIKSHADKRVVISDVRFDQEAQFVIDRAGQVIEVIRPGLITSGSHIHISEAGIFPGLISKVLTNEEGNKGALKDAVTQWASTL